MLRGICAGVATPCCATTTWMFGSAFSLICDLLSRGRRLLMFHLAWVDCPITFPCNTFCIFRDQTKTRSRLYCLLLYHGKVGGYLLDASVNSRDFARNSFLINFTHPNLLPHGCVPIQTDP